MESVCDNLAKGGPLMSAQLSTWINALLLSVADRLSGDIVESSADPMGFNQTIRQFFHGIETSVEKASEPWSVSEIARACRVGKTYLTDACHEIFNTTPSEQLNRIRLAHAARLLKEQPDMSVTEVAFATGFNTSQYFATRFRKHFGKSPKSYRTGIQ